MDRRARHPGEAVAAYRHARRGRDRRGAAGRRQGEDRRLHRRVRDQPGQRRRRSRSSSPTTCWPATAPARSWRCPAQDERDWEFAEVFDLPIIRTVQPPATVSTARRTPVTGRRHATPSRLPGRPGRRRGQGADHRRGWRRTGTAPARSPTGCATGCSAGSGTGASRSRSCTTRPARPIALPESMLPVELPEVDDFSPKTFDPDDADCDAGDAAVARPRLGRGRAGPGRRAEALHPRDQHDAAVGRLLLVRAALPGPDQRPTRFVDPENERVLDGPARRGRLPAASTCTSAASSTPCCTCCTRASGTRCCSTWATCRRSSRSASCSTRAYIQAYAYRDARGTYVPAEEVVERDGRYFHGEQRGHPRVRQDGQVAPPPTPPEWLLPGTAPSRRRPPRPARRRHPRPARRPRPAPPSPPLLRSRSRCRYWRRSKRRRSAPAAPKRATIRSMRPR